MRSTALLAALALVFASAGAVEARPRFGGDPRGTLSPQEARSAVEEGRHVPLQNILDQVQRRYPGRSLGAELRREDPPMYAITWLTEDNRRLHILANARTGQIVSVDGG